MNSDKRMSELYLERAAGKKHLYFNYRSEWRPAVSEVFYSDTEYKLAPETLDEFVKKRWRMQHDDPSYTYADAMRDGARWAWDNPERKDL